jgi:phosphatidylserine/phosphatidylglycerophosphate/cardiolipin synthase-like enzyme
VADYWLEQGISLHLSARVLVVLELLRSGRVEARLSADPGQPVHAKMYLGDGAVTVGSSNFSRSGLERQIEANVRFVAASADAGERARFEEGARFGGGVRRRPAVPDQGEDAQDVGAPPGRSPSVPAGRDRSRGVCSRAPAGRH